MNSTNKMKTTPYPTYISKIRRPVEPPRKIVNEGKVTFGTFSEPLKEINLLDCEKPCGKWLPDFLKSFRLKQWFAYLVDFDGGFILSAVYDTGLMMFNVVSFFDKTTRQTQTNMIFTSKKKNVFAHSLINSRIHLNAGGFGQEITNHFEDGKCMIKASCPASKKHFNYQAELSLESISTPSVVVMPLGPNKPLYIHKELFQAHGTISIGKQTFILNENATCIIDDHKGFYPYHMTYDWISGIKTDKNGTISFNIVDNQVIRPDDYNENFVWINGEPHPLPPVKVIKQSQNLWLAHDQHGAVDIRFDIEDHFVKRINLPFFKANYRAPFGKISGILKDLKGQEHPLEGTFGIGEDLDYRY